MTHGYDFGEMYTQEEGLSLTGMVISSVLFDNSGNYAGMVFENVKTGIQVVNSPISLSNLKKQEN